MLKIGKVEAQVGGRVLKGLYLLSERIFLPKALLQETE